MLSVGAGLRALGDALSELHEELSTAGWADDSPAGLEVTSEGVQLAEGYPDGSGSPVAEANRAGLHPLPLVADYLQSMAAALTEGSFYGVIALARIAAASAARANWIATPTIGARERARRYVTERLGALVDQQRLIADESVSTYKTLENRRNALLEWGVARGFQPVKTDRHGGIQGWALDSRSPSEMACVRDLLQHRNSQLPDFLFSFTSAFVHSTANAPLVLCHVSDGDGNVNPAMIAQITGAAVYGTDELMRRLHQQYGRDVGHWVGLRDPVLFRWSQFGAYLPG